MYSEWVAEQAVADSLEGAPPSYADALRAAVDSAGKRGYWSKRLETALAQADSGYLAPSILAECYAQRGDLERSFQSLKRAIVEHDPYWPLLLRDWALAPLRSDPRYAALMRENGLAP